MNQQVLPELMRRESRSFLLYIREAFPWADGKHAAVRNAIVRMGDEEAEKMAAIGRLLQKRHIALPGLGSFPTSFTNYNFLDAASLAPKLVAAERQSLADLDRDLSHITDDELRGAFEAYRDLKSKHLGELESIVAGKV